jgi:hypothetical protein
MEASRRNSAADDCGQHDGGIDLHFLIIASGSTADPSYNHSRDTLDPANQAMHHASHQLTQTTLQNKFHNHNDHSTYAGRCLNKQLTKQNKIPGHTGVCGQVR